MRQHAILPAPHLKHARQQLLERGIAPQTSIDKRIADSWQRSHQAGLPHYGGSPCADNLDAISLNRARQRNYELIRHSQPIIDFLFEQVKQSQSMVVLADAQGVLMHTVGDLDFLSKAERVALRCGATWAEQQRGTNAIGTALAECNEIEVHGAEHYLETNEFLTCAAAPILSAQGNLLGILDISGDHRSRQAHTLGLVSTAVQMIENSMVLSPDRYPIVLQFHAQAAGIASVAQGILALSEDGFVLGANRRALHLLGLRFADLSRLHWSQMFDLKLEEFLSQQTRRFATLVQFHTRLGKSFFAQLHPHSQVLRTAAQQYSGKVIPAHSSSSHVDPQWQESLAKGRRVFERDIPLLLSGESGVGKEVFAKQVHTGSTRQARHFAAVNCAAIPEHLIEAELFGYVPGAFTGALKQGSPGRIREADGGTLFLDEIGDMPLSLQTRLLRVLQERTVMPVGSGSAVPVDFRLICASHQNLREKVKLGQFREDLFYRINGLQLQLPALRDRTDFAALCASILHEFSPQLTITFAPQIMQTLQSYSWPGNVRQLRHCLRTATALLDDEETQIEWQHFAQDMLTEFGVLSGEHERDQAVTLPIKQKSFNHGEATSTLEQNELAIGDVRANGFGANGLPSQFDDFPKLKTLSAQAIEHALRLTEGNVSEAARRLGVSRQTLYRKMRE
ncbi:sigma-54-dependent Fis family transcriptional regulator [Undibacterium cyanobacteriorum]|uniref:Sigma-54-dependent Fis family transcriptional regulator n=1 Tax=Undibacterium cyanobacteriorum TaxID=3073561 RepID=A0ABY9RKG4_9BURK|nr:sigma-54-dependent Fis family transcriptional regulator [Undibacterium sp. 20NA77.5]WMW81334.1 sigma-54-dependent Fis family transcriptional regulator [Undibacterium sp. 20NA77.5]